MISKTTIHLTTLDMRETQTKRVTPAQMLPGLTKSVPNVGEPGQSDDKWATGTRTR